MKKAMNSAIVMGSNFLSAFEAGSSLYTIDVPSNNEVYTNLIANPIEFAPHSLFHLVYGHEQ